MAIRVFIVDDHYMVIEGINALLQNEPEIELCGHATNITSCMAYLSQQRPDVILMDISLGAESGIDLCKMVKEKYPSIFTIGLSTFNQQSFIRRMMENGASGYVLKNATKKELLDAIRTAARGRDYFSHEALKPLRTPAQSGIVLTRREKEVLELIANGLTNNQIAQVLFVSNTTVDTHRSHLLMKLEAKNTAELVKKAFAQKLISSGD